MFVNYIFLIVHASCVQYVWLCQFCITSESLKIIFFSLVKACSIFYLTLVNNHNKVICIYSVYSKELPLKMQFISNCGKVVEWQVIQNNALHLQYTVWLLNYNVCWCMRQATVQYNLYALTLVYHIPDFYFHNIISSWGRINQSINQPNSLRKFTSQPTNQLINQSMK